MAKPRKTQTALPTMHDVARLAGVSQTTVSFVLNNAPNANISEETRQRILAAVAQLGYRPNAIAKNLRSQRSHAIGLVTDLIASTPYAGRIVQGAQDAAAEFDKVLFLANTGGNAHVEKTAIETMLNHQIEGLIYATMFHRDVTPPPELSHIPSVLLNCKDPQRSLPSVVPDEFTSAFNAVRLLVEKGHRAIGFINSIDTGPATQGRLAGYTQALQEYNIPIAEELICYGESRQNSGYVNGMRLMQQTPRPTAIFCFNDQVAMGVYEALHELRLRIPEDVAVIGFDNLDIIAAYLRPPLSTMELPHYQMGQWAVRFLVSPSEQPCADEPVQQTLICPYIQRMSA